MESADEKTVAAVRSQMAALAERNGHPVGLALAMVDIDVELAVAARRLRLGGIPRHRFYHHGRNSNAVRVNPADRAVPDRAIHESRTIHDRGARRL